MGIQILYPTGEDEKDIDLNLSLTLDIIAIHGLNGNPLTTWTDPKSQILWFRDLLPTSIPNSRTLTFGYDATAAFERSTAGILEHARDLLRCLEELRRDREEIHRPLLFVAHSLGGLVLKQALVIAANGGHRQYKPIWDATVGALFFGTPHRGSSLATYGAQLARVPTALSMKPSPRLLNSLSIGCLELEELNDVFKNLMEKDGNGREVVSFYETRTMLGWMGLVVEQSSALINLAHSGKDSEWETPIPVNANHRTMCRFSDVSDPAYATAVNSIERLRRRGAVEDVRNEFYVVPSILNPHFTGRNDIRSVMRDKLLDKTCIVGGGIHRSFVLYGMGGSGKTQVSLKFAQDFKNRFWAIFFVDASSLANAANGFHTIAKSLKLPTSPLPNGTINTVKSHLAAKRDWLLIIDNADNPQLDLSQFLPEGTNGSILITTRNTDFVKYANVGDCCVERMIEDDAVSLLLKASGLDKQTREDKEGEESNDETQGNRREKSAKDVVTKLGCLALAIIQAGAVIRQRMVSLEGFCELYSMRSKELLESGRPSVKIEGQKSVHTTWEISLKMIQELNEKHAELALELLRLFAFMHFDGISQEILQRAVYYQGFSGLANEYFATTLLVRSMLEGWDGILVGRALGLLASFSLITYDEEGQISMHPLVHQWSKERMMEQERFQAFKTASITIAMSTFWVYDNARYRERRTLLRHIDACLDRNEGQLFRDGPDLGHQIFAALTFAKAYRESNRAVSLIISTKSLKCIETMMPPGYKHHITALKDVAQDLYMLGRYKEVVPAWEKVVEWEKSDAGAGIELIASSIKKLAEAYNAMGEFQKAIDVCEKARKEYIGELGEGNLQMIYILEVIGVAKRMLLNWKEARKCLELGLEMRKKYFGECPEHQVSVAHAVLAEIYWAQRRYKKSVLTQEEYVEHMRASHGPDDLFTIAATARLEDLRSSQLMLVTSVKRRAMKITATKEALIANPAENGEVNAAALECMEQLAEDYWACGALEKARDLHGEILQIQTKTLGIDHYRTVATARMLKRVERLLVVRKVCYWWLPRAVRERDWLGR